MLRLKIVGQVVKSILKKLNLVEWFVQPANSSLLNYIYQSMCFCVDFKGELPSSKLYFWAFMQLKIVGVYPMQYAVYILAHTVEHLNRAKINGKPVILGFGKVFKPVWV